MTFDNLLLERIGPVAVVTINRPAVLNALNGATIDELESCIGWLAADVEVRAMVLTGAGERSFAAGGDIAELARLTPGAAYEVARRGQAFCNRLERCPKPIVAAIQGFALGGGCEIAMACTVRIAAETARLGQPEVKLGLLPGYGGTQRLPRLVGPGRALELLLTGAIIDAREALRLGLVNRVVPADRLGGEALKLAQSLAAQAPLAVRYILDAVREGTEMTLSQGCEHEAALFSMAVGTSDAQEGTGAFLDKRQPDFKGQ